MNRVKIDRGARASQAGSAMMEFGLILPLAVLLFLGAADFARVFYDAIMTTNAARAGAGYGVESAAKAKDLSGMQQAALADAENASGMTATAERFCECSDGSAISCSSSCGVNGPRVTYVRVTTQKTFQTVVPYPGIPSSIPVTARAVMRAQ